MHIFSSPHFSIRTSSIRHLPSAILGTRSTSSKIMLLEICFSPPRELSALYTNFFKRVILNPRYDVIELDR